MRYLLPILLVLAAACRERSPATVALRAPAPYRAATGESGRAATLVVDGRDVDRADVGFGVHRLGADSLVYRRVLVRRRTWYAPPDTETTYLLHGAGERVLLSRMLPLWEDGFARPLVRGDTVHYWGVRRTGLEHGVVYAMRHVFSSGRTDSLRIPLFHVGSPSERPVGPPVAGAEGTYFAGVRYRYAPDQPAALVRHDFRIWQRQP